MEPQPTFSTVSTSTPISDSRSLYALVIAIVGLAIPTFLICYLVNINRGLTLSESGTNPLIWEASAITSVAGLFTSIVGTLVGAFLGVQVGAAGREQAEARAANAEKKKEEAENVAFKAMGMLPPEQARSLHFRQ